MERLTLGLKEAAAALGMSHWTLRQYVREGKLGHIRIGRRVLVEPSEIERIMSEGRKEATR